MTQIDWIPFDPNEVEHLPDTPEARLSVKKQRALDDIRHVNYLKESLHWQWFQKQMERRVQAMEARIWNKSAVADEELPTYRLQVEEARNMLNLLDRIEKAMQATIDQVDDTLSAAQRAERRKKEDLIH